MIKLIKLELKKVKLLKYVRSVFIANLVLIALMLTISYSSKVSQRISFHSFNDMFLIINTFVKSVFIIFSAVIISKVIIDEFSQGTIMVLFTYPISRKKLIISKIVIVLMFTFISTFLSDIFISTFMLISNNINSFINDSLTSSSLIQAVKNFMFYALEITGISLIPLFFGMRKKSSRTTIVSSIILMALLSSNSNNFCVEKFPIIQISLATLGILSAYLSLRNIENVDLIKGE